MKEYLPIGTVVRLKGGEKKVMIFGRKQLADDSKEYDYISCLFPEGNISPEYNFLFNNEDVDEIFFKGFVNDEEEDFQKILKNA